MKKVKLNPLIFIVVCLVTSNKSFAQSLEMEKTSTQYISNWISIVASLTNITTVILTYLLLRETQKTLKHSTRIYERDTKRAEAETMNSLHKNFQNTYMAMLNDIDTLGVLSEAEKVTATEVKVNFYSSFLINNVSQLYTYRQNKFIPDKEWNNLRDDIIAFFEYPFILGRWEAIKKYYPKDFKVFIDKMLNDQKTN